MLPKKKSQINKNKFKKRVDQLETKNKKELQAFAIKYDVDKDKSPKIIAQGNANIAEMILEIAEDHKIPLYEDPSLSKLLSKLKLNQSVPPKLYAILAEILAFAYQLEKLSSKKAKVMKKINK